MEHRMDITALLRQCVLQAADTYNASIELPAYFETKNQLFEDLAKSLCQDFSAQLQPVILNALHHQFDQQTK